MQVEPGDADTRDNEDCKFVAVLELPDGACARRGAAVAAEDKGLDVPERKNLGPGQRCSLRQLSPLTFLRYLNCDGNVEKITILSGARVSAACFAAFRSNFLSQRRVRRLGVSA